MEGRKGRVREGGRKEGRKGHRWLMPVISATQEAEIRRIVVRSAWAIVYETLSQKNPSYTHTHTHTQKGWWNGSKERK
jgi:hypothetical protein